MPTIDLTPRQGPARPLTGRDGQSLMEAIRRGGVYELEAVCGGSCSCATCHVYVDAAFTPALPPIGEVEADLLDTCEHRTGLSRLACQIPLSAALDGMAVTIAPAE